MNIPTHHLAYLVGKGPSLDNLTADDFQDHDAPVLACNEAIHTIEHLELPNPVFCVQQDASLNETCRPKRSGWILSRQAWRNGKGDTYAFAHEYIPEEIGLKTSSLTAVVAIRLLSEAHVKKIVMLAFDAHVNGNCNYANAIGHSHHRDDQADDRFIRGGDAIAHYGMFDAGLVLAFQPPRNHWNIVTALDRETTAGQFNAFADNLRSHLKTPYTLHVIGYSDFATMRPNHHWGDDRFAKLEAFSPDAPLAGGTLYIDPDTVVGRDIALPEWDILTPGLLYACQDGWRPGKFGTGIMAWRAGTVHRPFLDFDAHPAKAGTYRLEDIVNDSMPGALRPIPFLNVKSYKIDKPASPSDADAVLFHGLPKPWAPEVAWLKPVEEANEITTAPEISIQEAAPAKTVLPSTALVTCFYGGSRGKDDLRRTATKRAVASWDEQKAIPQQALFLELVCPGQMPCFDRADLPAWMQYIRIFGKERNRNLFQKEALWNLGAKFTSAEKLLFLDCDCMPVGTFNYFEQIFYMTRPGKCVHAAWHIIHEGQKEAFQDFYSIFAPQEDVPAGAKRFPGMGFSLHRQDYHAIDGFNPYGISGSGDAVFIWECMNDPLKYPIKTAKRYHQSLVRPNRPQLEPVVVKGLTVQHNFHGMKSERGYVWSRCAVELFGHPSAYCHIDSSGLLAWNDSDFPLKYFVMEKARMHTKEELYDLICEVFKARLDEIEARHKNKEYQYDTTEWNQYD